MLYKWHISDAKILEQPKQLSTPSLTATSVATESECAPSDTNIGWEVERTLLSSWFAWYGQVPSVVYGSAEKL